MSVTIKGKVPKVGTGHRPHKTGAGKHKHKNDRRNSRSASRRRSIEES